MHNQQKKYVLLLYFVSKINRAAETMKGLAGDENEVTNAIDEIAKATEEL
ncbi:hypothetical protein [Bacillus cereus]|jgi:hypothetical protein|nr:hypothetical protein [Bacillus cereus]